MFVYEKKLQYPVNIKTPNGKLAQIIASQYGGPHGEIGASLRYLSQRYTMPHPELKAVLTDVGTEELGHLEMVGTIVYQLTRGLTPDEIKASGLETYFVDHTSAVYPQAASGTPFSAATLAVTGDTIADLHENMAAEQKARMTYDNILRFADDPDVRDPIKFLRAREVVHYQRFGEALRIATDKLDSKNFYAFNPSYDKGLRRNNSRGMGYNNSNSNSNQGSNNNLENSSNNGSNSNTANNSGNARDMNNDSWRKDAANRNAQANSKTNGYRRNDGWKN